MLTELTRARNEAQNKTKIVKTFHCTIGVGCFGPSAKDRALR
jgi:hypothetical protein